MNKEMYDSNAKLFKTIAIVILVLGLLAGIICGNAYPAIAERNIGTSSNPIPKIVEVFNFGLMLAIWLGSAGGAAASMATYYILDSMVDILIELKRLNQKAKGIEDIVCKSNLTSKE